jgi:hypothetical protein
MIGMKKALSFLIVLAMTAPLAGCLVRTGPRYRSNGQQARSCPPSSHWEGGVCVHNGNGRGNGRGRGH